MKSWHTHLPSRMQTHTAGRDANVIRLVPTAFFCLECETYSCLHVSATQSFLAGHYVPQLVVREDTDNPHVIQQISYILSRTRDFVLFSQLRVFWNNEVPTVVPLDPDTYASVERLLELSDRYTRGYTADYVIFDEIKDKEPEPPKSDPSPFDLVELD